jgi:protein-tyrosine phosphatase
MHRPTAFLRKLEGKTVEELLRAAPKFLRDVFERRTVEAYFRSTLHATPTARARRRQSATERLREAEELLFLCHGNICRSPFAERYARRRLDKCGIGSLEVDSAGAVEMNDPRSPRLARTVAGDYGVELDDHRSVRATAEAVDAADLVLVMDYRNYRTYTTRYPDAADRTFLLGVFQEGRAIQITDPHGYDRKVFASVYADVVSGVESLLDAYEVAIGRKST